MFGEDEIDTDRLREHFEILADALAAPGKDAPDDLLPMSAPNWLWEAWERRQLDWLGWEHTYAELEALPLAADGTYPEEDWCEVDR